MLENAIALLLGIALNFLTTLKDRNETGKRVYPWAWCKANPYTAALAILAPLTGAWVMGLGEISKLTAAGLGYAGSDVTSSIAAGAKNRVAR
jgi:hypothetical protein